MRLLAIDIGNTHTVLGMFQGTTLLGEWRLSSSKHRTSDELWQLLKGFLADAGIPLESITAAGIASVVPHATPAVQSLIEERLRIRPLLISGADPHLIRNRYIDPSAVGADRICNAVAGFAQYGGPLIIIDFGTATTFDVVGEEGDYLGGTIALGIESQASALHRRTAKLPKIDLRTPPQVIGRDTVSSMQSGILYGAVDAVQGMIARVRNELRHDARVIATGGLSSIIAPLCPSINALEPSLVLKGIRILCERSSGK